MRLCSLVACVGIAAAVGCSSTETQTPSLSVQTWTVGDGFVRDPEGRAVIARGVNLSNAHKQPPYFGFHQPDDYRRIREQWGMNAVRYLIVWAAIEPTHGHYDLDYLQAVRQRIEWARDAGLLVIVDMHQDIYGEGFGGDGAPRWTCPESHYEQYEPATPWFVNYMNEHVMACFDAFYASTELQDQYAEAWVQVAQVLADMDNVIGFDLMNEPHWGSAGMQVFEQELLQPFYVRVVERIRRVAPGWIAFLEPGATRNVGIPTTLSRFPFDHVVYSPHSYDVNAEQGLGFDDSNRKSVIFKVQQLAEEARQLDAALWIGEYGGMADHAGIVPYMDAQYDAAAQVAAGGMYWAYDRDSGYGMLKPDGEEKLELLATLVRPFPERVAGDPTFYSFDEATGSFVLSYRPDPAVQAPTVISVAERIYPGGYTVECGDCAFARAPGQLEITSGSEAVVEVRVSPALGSP